MLSGMLIFLILLNGIYEFQNGMGKMQKSIYNCLEWDAVWMEIKEKNLKMLFGFA